MIATFSYTKLFFTLKRLHWLKTKQNMKHFDREILNANTNILEKLCQMYEL